MGQHEVTVLLCDVGPDFAARMSTLRFDDWLPKWKQASRRPDNIGQEKGYSQNNVTSRGKRVLKTRFWFTRDRGLSLPMNQERVVPGARSGSSSYRTCGQVIESVKPRSCLVGSRLRIAAVEGNLTKNGHYRQLAPKPLNAC
jgi:hypothetical protein